MISRFGLGSIILFLLLWLGCRVAPLPAQFVQGSFVVLLLMLVRAVFVMAERMLRYRMACDQSVQFAREATAHFEVDNLEAAISIAQDYKKSHIAAVALSGLREFRASLFLPSDMDKIVLAERALRRAAAAVQGEMKRGFNSLATIASTAPLVGLFATVFGIVDSFKGTAASKETVLGILADSLADALVTNAFGILVAILALWSLNYLREKMGLFDAEIVNASSELLTYFSLYLARQSMAER